MEAIKLAIWLFFTTETVPAESIPSPKAADLSNGQPNIMRKRGYEQTNGDDAPSMKRMNIGVIRQAGNIRSSTGNVVSNFKSIWPLTYIK